MPFRNGKMMESKIVSQGAFFVAAFFLLSPFTASVEPSGFAPVSRTRQTTCYDPSGNSVNCKGTGQDGEYQKGVAWSDPRFTDHGDGVVTDNLTGLMWTKSAQHIKGTMKWSEALAACNDLVWAGYSDWRLPNIKELISLIDYGEHDPALPAGHPFDDAQFIFYWTSTTYDSITNHAWGAYVCNGYVYNYHKATAAYAWSVRDGK